MALKQASVEFHHVHLYVDKLEPLDVYEAKQARLTKFCEKSATNSTVAERRAEWTALGDAKDPKDFASAGQDIVDQLLTGVGMRITGKADVNGSRSLLVQSSADEGVKYLISAKTEESVNQATKRAKQTSFDHFQATKIDNFMAAQAGRQGIAVLAFEVTQGGVQSVAEKYQQLHPKLVVAPVHEYDSHKIFEVYAYYTGEVLKSEVHKGTILRFVEKISDSTDFLPGLTMMSGVKYPTNGSPLYFDHWVSNVVSRTGFLSTLKDTLGFDMKVDFNAGVVAAGEAQIESSVMGNVGKTPDSDVDALRSRSQIYLPTNNALSPVGHVHWYLEEIGQGVQHLAQRMDDIAEFIQTTNEMREITGGGFTFLNIPRSYYGRLQLENFTKPRVGGVGLAAPVAAATGEALLKAITTAGICDSVGIVKLDTARADVVAVVKGVLESSGAEDTTAEDVANVVIVAIYSNLKKLLGDHLDEAQYLKIVRNEILVDIQNDDILYQIFTCTVLHRKAGEEAPFLEFIQRQCSQKCNPDGSKRAITPGCGGFGIRNFLTLFLSIELTKALNEMNKAKSDGNEKGRVIAEKKVEVFTNQLEEANPILTAISDAMTEAGIAKDIVDAPSSTDAEREKAQKKFDECEARREKNNKLLQVCAQKHSDWMRAVCEGRA